MAYQAPWYPRDPEKSRLDAERRAGPSDLGYLYRLDEVSYAGTPDPETDERGPSDLRVEIKAYIIEKATPKGFWIDPQLHGYLNSGGRRFVLTKANKRFACVTVQEALESYVARKTRQAQILEAQARRARQCISLAQDLSLFSGFL